MDRGTADVLSRSNGARGLSELGRGLKGNNHVGLANGLAYRSRRFKASKMLINNQWAAQKIFKTIILSCFQDDFIFHFKSFWVFVEYLCRQFCIKVSSVKYFVPNKDRIFLFSSVVLMVLLVLVALLVLMVLLVQ